MLTKKKPAHRLAFILDTFRYMEETQLSILSKVLKQGVYKSCLSQALTKYLYNCAICIVFFLDGLDQIFTLDAQPHGNRCRHENR